jgi:hypothetical protein
MKRIIEEDVPLKRTVILDFDVEGYHNWPDAPHEVQFLRNPHRHTFRIRAGIEVSHNDREVEIFIEQNKVREALFHKYEKRGRNSLDFGNHSCEDIAEFILSRMVRGFTWGFVSPMEQYKWVEVLEDGRGGARVEVKE